MPAASRPNRPDIPAYTDALDRPAPPLPAHGFPTSTHGLPSRLCARRSRCSSNLLGSRALPAATADMAASTAKPSKRSSPKTVEFPPLLSSSSSAAAASSSSSAKPVAHRLLRKGSVGKPPLVPLTEARQYQHERSASRGAARETESEKWDANPDNASAARDGRQFAVANVGNHGRIYLRYVKLLLPLGRASQT